jgi:hypothetical protein
MAQEGKKGASKKPGPPKCRACGGLVDEKETVYIGGKRWHYRCAEQKKKFIPREYVRS